MSVRYAVGKAWEIASLLPFKKQNKERKVELPVEEPIEEQPKGPTLEEWISQQPLDPNIITNLLLENRKTILYQSKLLNERQARLEDLKYTTQDYALKYYKQHTKNDELTAELKKKEEHFQLRISEKEKENMELNEKCEKLKHEISTLSKSNKELEENLKSYQTDISNATRELETKTKTIENTTTEYNNLKCKFKEVDELLKNKDSELETIKQAMEQLNCTSQSKIAELQALSKALETNLASKQEVFKWAYHANSFSIKCIDGQGWDANADVISKSDPYCELKFNNQTVKTRTCQDTGSRGQWNQVFTFKGHPRGKLEILVKDEDPFKDEVLSKGSVDLEDLIKTDAVQTIQLSNGAVRLALCPPEEEPLYSPRIQRVSSVGCNSSFSLMAGPTPLNCFHFRAICLDGSGWDDGSGSCYCRLQFNSHTRMTMVSSDKEKKWNHALPFQGEAVGVLDISIVDYKENKELAKGSINLEDLHDVSTPINLEPSGYVRMLIVPSVANDRKLDLNIHCLKGWGWASTNTDLYCQVFTGNEKQTTELVKATTEAEWNKSMKFNTAVHETIEIRIYESNGGEDNLIGQGWTTVGQCFKVTSLIDLFPQGKLSIKVTE